MQSTFCPRIFLTPGEPAGIGPDLTVQISQQSWPVELVIIADPELIHQRASRLNIPITLPLFDPTKPPEAGTLKILPVTLSAPCIPGKLAKENASYVIQCLEVATQLCLNKIGNALVTGPVQKSILIDAGYTFTGHTEFLAQHCGVSEVIMLFTVDTMKVALLTIHIPLSAVPAAITEEKLVTTLMLLHAELQKKYGIPSPRILVCGLNPHAGEHGHLGREEIEIIEPTLKKLREKGLDVIGPLPADTAFTPSALQKADVVLAMYHDQALPVVKYAGFNHAVNVTLGLPIIRTSVDHGTALDLAGTALADTGSLVSAINEAILLSSQQDIS